MKFLKMLAVMAIVAIVPITDSYSAGTSSSAASSVARSSSSGSSFGVSKPTSNSSSSGVNKPPSSTFGVNKPITPAAAPPPSTFGVNKPITPASTPPSSAFGVSKPITPAATSPSPKNDAVSTAAAKVQSKSAFASFQAEQNKQYAKPPTPVNLQQAKSNPTFTNVERNYQTNGRFDRQRYLSDYNTARSNITVINPTRYVYINAGPPNYGSWSAVTFWALLGTSMAISDANAAWAMQHRNDAAYQQWYANAQIQAQKDADLKAQLAALDAKVSMMQANNVKITAPALPEGISQTVAIAPQAVLADNPDDDDGLSFMTIILTLGTLGFCVLAFLAWRGAQLRRNAY